jgi:hypothetical protein
MEKENKVNAGLYGPLQGDTGNESVSASSRHL